MRRGQLVLLGAAVVALALVPATTAYLQLGYHGDVRATGNYDDPLAETNATFTRAFRDGSRGVPTEFAWADRAEAVATVRERVRPTVRAVERGGPGVRRVTYDQTAAVRLADRACPGGPDRQFGPCEARDGVVVQRRANRTHVVAAGFDVRTRAPERDRRATLIAWR